jgi:hypothetical protein
VTESFTTTEQLVDQDPAGFLSAIRELTIEKNRRDAEAQSPEVITYTPEDDRSDADLVPPGTVTLFMAPRGDAFLNRVRAVYRDGDRSAIASLTGEAVTGASTRQRLTPGQAARDLIGGLPFGDLRYRGKTLAECVGLTSDLTYGVLPLAYAGGELDDAQFQFVQYVMTEGQTQRLDVVLVKRPPHLTDIELEILTRKRQKIEEILARDEIFVGPNNPVAVTVTTVTIALFVVAVHTPTYFAGAMEAREMSRRFERISRIVEDRISALGPAATVGDLIQARINVMSRLY